MVYMFFFSLVFMVFHVSLVLRFCLLNRWGSQSKCDHRSCIPCVVSWTDMCISMSCKITRILQYEYILLSKITLNRTEYRQTFTQYYQNYFTYAIFFIGLSSLRNSLIVSKFKDKLMYHTRSSMSIVSFTFSSCHVVNSEFTVCIGVNTTFTFTQ